MKKISSQLLNLTISSAKKMIPDELIGKRLSGKPSFARERQIMPDMTYHDERFMLFKQHVYELLSPQKDGTFVVENSDYLDGGDASVLATDMQIPGLPFQYIQRTPIVNFSMRELVAISNIRSFFVKTARDDGRLVAMNLKTSFGGMVGNIKDPEIFVDMLKLGMIDADIFQTLSMKRRKGKYYDTKQLIIDSFNLLSYPSYIKIMNRDQVKKVSKIIKFIDPVTNKEVEQLSNFLTTPNSKYEELGVPQSFIHRLNGLRKAYDIVDDGPFKKDVHSSRNRTIFPCPGLNKNLTAYVTPLLGTFKDRISPLASQGPVEDEPIRGTPFYHDYMNMVESQGFIKARSSFLMPVTKHYQESIVIGYDFTNFDQHVSSNEQFHICNEDYNSLLPFGMKIAHYPRVIPIIANDRYRREGLPFAELDPFSDDWEYPLKENNQNFSGEYDVTLTNYIMSLAYLVLLTGFSIEDLLKQETRKMICVYMHSDDCLLVIHEPRILELIFTNWNISFNEQKLNFSKIPKKYHVIFKKYCKPQDDQAIIKNSILGLEAKVSSIPEILKNTFYYRKEDGMITACHSLQNYFAGMLCPEGDYKYRSSGELKEFPNLRPYAREKIYCDNPYVSRVLGKIDDISQKCFGKPWLDNFPLSEIELQILNDFTLSERNIPIGMQEYLLDSKPDLLEYKMTPDQFDAELLKKYFLTIGGNERLELLTKKNTDRDSLMKKINGYLKGSLEIKTEMRNS